MAKQPRYYPLEIWVCEDCEAEREQPHYPSCPFYVEPRRQPRKKAGRKA